MKIEFTAAELIVLLDYLLGDVEEDKKEDSCPPPVSSYPVSDYLEKPKYPCTLSGKHDVGKDGYGFCDCASQPHFFVEPPLNSKVPGKCVWCERVYYSRIHFHPSAFNTNVAGIPFCICGLRIDDAIHHKR